MSQHVELEELYARISVQRRKSTLQLQDYVVIQYKDLSLLKKHTVSNKDTK